MDNMNEIVNVSEVDSLVIELRGQKVLLDKDVATLYGVDTKRVNEAVKNNQDKFPKEYVIELVDNDIQYLRSKISTANFSPSTAKLSSKTRVTPKAFSERGLYMLATVLKSPRATQTTLAIIEAFTGYRERYREDTPTLVTGTARPIDLPGILERFIDMSGRQMDMMAALLHGRGAGPWEGKEDLSCEEHTTLVPGANEYRRRVYGLCDEIILYHGNLRSRPAVLTHIYGVMAYATPDCHSSLSGVDWEEEKASFKLSTGYRVVSKLGMLANREEGYPAKRQLLDYLSSFLEAIKGHGNG